jgi:hypothetical protein
VNRIAKNPFYLLGIAPSASAVEVEREGRKLLGMLELGLASARRYLSPLGERERTPEMVREAMAELRDPQKRLICELWARLDPRAFEATGDREDGEDGEDGGYGEDLCEGEEEEEWVEEDEPQAAEPWPEAGAALGWRRA